MRDKRIFHIFAYAYLLISFLALWLTFIYCLLSQERYCFFVWIFFAVLYFFVNHLLIKDYVDKEIILLYEGLIVFRPVIYIADIMIVSLF